MARKDFDAPDTYRGGALSEPAKPKRLHYPCFATGCPMAGTMWTTRLGDDRSKDGNAEPTSGSCPFHYGINPNNIPRVTQVLRDWLCVSEEIQAARRCLTGDMASDPAGQAQAFETAWKRLQPSVARWEDELKPGNVRTSKGVERPFRETYGDWARRLEAFLAARVAQALNTRRPS